MLVQDDGKWSAQVEQMVKRAERTTWVLQRMHALGVDQAPLVAYWKAEGRVHLEFACPVWHSGLTTAQAQDLRMDQRTRGPENGHGGHHWEVGALPCTRAP